MQIWKKAPPGKRLVELLGDEIAEQDPALGERAAELAKAVLTTIGIKVAPPRGKKELPEESGYLVFLNNLQIRMYGRVPVVRVRSNSPRFRIPPAERDRRRS